MKKYIYLVLFAFVLSLSSCEDDSVESVYSPDIKLMEQTWKKVKVTYSGKELDRRKKTGLESLPNSDYFIALKDNDFQIQDGTAVPGERKSSNSYGRWWMYQNALTIAYHNYPTDKILLTDVYEVTKLTETELVLEKIILFQKQVSPSDTLYNGDKKFTDVYEPIKIEFTAVK